MGSDFGVPAFAGTIATPSWMVLPPGFVLLLGSARFSGTVSVPQRAPSSSSTGSGVFGQGPGS